MTIISSSATGLSAVATSTGILIWAAVGLVGFCTGLVSVRVARHKSSRRSVAAASVPQLTDSPASRHEPAAEPASSAAPAGANVRETQNA